MSEPIFEQCVDERGNISVRVSRDVQVLTREEANHIEAEYKRMQAENAKLRDKNSRLRKYISKALSTISYCDCCLYVDYECDTETVPMHEGCKAFEELRKLGVKVD